MFLMTSLLRKRLFIGYFITGFIVISMVTAMITLIPQHYYKLNFLST